VTNPGPEVKLCGNPILLNPPKSRTSISRYFSNSIQFNSLFIHVTAEQPKGQLQSKHTLKIERREEQTK
jgi:hypothetical protein